MGKEWIEPWYITNGGRDEPDVRDFEYEIVYGSLEGQQRVKRPKEIVVVFDQFSNLDTHMACTRFALRHINNGQNIQEHGADFAQVNPREDRLDYIEKYPDAKYKWSSKQSAMKQAVSDGWISGFTACRTVEQCRDAIDRWKYIYTGSNNGDWVQTIQTGVYSIQKEKVIWHLFAIVGYNEHWFLGLNSVRKNPYFHIGYEYFDTMYSKHAISDAQDRVMLSFKERHQRIKRYERVINEISAMRHLASDTERDLLHEANNKLREARSEYYP